MKKITLKRLVLAAAVCAACTTASAQTRVITNTVTPKDLSVYNGKEVNLSIFRYIHKGWNTICLPVSLTTDELNSIFGDDCRLETLVGVESTGTATKLNFQDVKPDGLKANTPYILYSTLDSDVREVHLTTQVTTADVAQEFTDNTGTKVVFGGATEAGDTDGLYAILVKDNASATFVDVSNVTSGIRASRCYIKLNGGETTNTLTTNHIDHNATGVESVTGDMADGELVDVYNISGVKVASQITPGQVRNLPKGAYVAKGKCFLVR